LLTSLASNTALFARISSSSPHKQMER
jgi:hypothetical protein